MNKFTDKPKKTVKPTVKKVTKERNGEIIKKGEQTFIICPKCGWQHTIDTVECRFCGAKL